MYAMLFASALHPEYFLAIRKQIDDRGEKRDEMIEEEITHL